MIETRPSFLSPVELDHASEQRIAVLTALGELATAAEAMQKAAEAMRFLGVHPDNEATMIQDREHMRVISTGLTCDLPAELREFALQHRASWEIRS